jgi:hypothetical protein
VCDKDEFVAHVTGEFMGMGVVGRVTNQLNQAAFIAQIDKYDPSMVAVAVRPTAQNDVVAYVCFT